MDHFFAFASPSRRFWRLAEPIESGQRRSLALSLSSFAEWEDEMRRIFPEKRTCCWCLFVFFFGFQRKRFVRRMIGSAVCCVWIFHSVSISCLRCSAKTATQVTTSVFPRFFLVAMTTLMDRSGENGDANFARTVSNLLGPANQIRIKVSVSSQQLMAINWNFLPIRIALRRSLSASMADRWWKQSLLNEPSPPEMFFVPWTT